MFWINEALGLGYNPLMIVGICVVGATLGTCTIRLCDDRIHQALEHHKKRHQKLADRIKIPPIKTPKFKHLSEWTERLLQKVHLSENPYTIGLIIALLTSSVLHDIFVVEIGRKKMSFPQFVASALVGKLILFAPLVFGRQ
jgi:membrane protein YqaA with SNARE-associated domain